MVASSGQETAQAHSAPGSGAQQGARDIIGAQTPPEPILGAGQANYDPGIENEPAVL
jgi:hypothetical protein